MYAGEFTLQLNMSCNDLVFSFPGGKGPGRQGMAFDHPNVTKPQKLMDLTKRKEKLADTSWFLKEKGTKNRWMTWIICGDPVVGFTDWPVSVGVASLKKVDRGVIINPFFPS